MSEKNEKHSIREMVQEIQNEVKAGNVGPRRAAEMLNDLAALMGPINEYLINFQFEHNQMLLIKREELESEERKGSAAMAKIYAEAQPSYKNLLAAKALKSEVEALISSLKYYQKSLEAEYQNSKYQH